MVGDAADEAASQTGLTAYVTCPAGYVADIVKAFAGIDGLFADDPALARRALDGE